MAPKKLAESEWITRKRRIDPRLDACGWRLPAGPAPSVREPFRTEEEPTDAGPADYALWLDRDLIGIVEAKKVTLGPQNVLTQAERYARGLRRRSHDYAGLRCPFLYATNGEVVWFHDVRHPLNLSRQVSGFHTPAALGEMLARDFEAACDALRATPNDRPRLWPFQRRANDAIEKAIAERKRRLLVAMATGTGKTFTMVNQVHRLMQAEVAKRVLFLVDRRALAAQAVRAFASFETTPGRKFDQDYEVYSSRFQAEDFGEEEAFDPKAIPTRYLTDPSPDDAFVYVCTIQRMAINVLGRQAIFGAGDEAIDEDADRIEIPIHAFDVIVADECHRGYTSAEQSVWRSTLDHFDAIKIGLTATPAAHTVAYFTHKVFEYGFDDAVRDGYLVPYDVVTLESNVRMNGVFLREGEQVERVDPETGLKALDQMEDERQFDTTEIERRITSPDSNRKILEEVKRYAEAHEREYHRFPKTLIFAVNDVPHTSHADQLVATAREVFVRGEAFVDKITGRVDRPLEHIRRFRNRPMPAVVVTVDLLTTGVDIPDLEFIVFLRPVKSRILFAQMIGRGTRKGERLTDKSHFTVVDCFDGTLLAYFKGSTDVTKEPLDQPSKTIAEIVAAIWDNRDREYHTRCLVRRLHRVDKQMSGEARALFAAFVPDGDLARYARELPAALRRDFVGTMKLLRDPAFQDLLVTYRRPPATFLVAHEVVDTVTSRWLVRDGAGKEHLPEDYLAAFSRFVRENPAHIEAIRILQGRPRAWSGEALHELRAKLAASTFRFTEENLRRAHEATYHRALVDIISMVKHAADDHAPLLTAAERTARAFARLRAAHAFTPDQEKWLARIEAHLQENLSIDADDFDLIPIFADNGGLGVVKRAFPKLDELLFELNEAMAA